MLRDREDAGRQLAEHLEQYARENPIVLALPRGGVPVGYEIARELHAPLDVLVARKLGAPGHEEFGIGAIAPGGVRILDQEAIAQLGIPQSYIDEVEKRERAEIERRTRSFR